ncbi:MAG: endolytic transglycosylase MltG [Candidatus Parcubacteria bacterium]|jgi:UPF0755 protein
MLIWIKRLLILGITLIVLVLIILAMLWLTYFAAPSDLVINESRLNDGKGGTVITLDAGKNIVQFAEELEDMQVIKSKKVFLTMIEKLQVGKQIKGGTYVFTDSEHVLRILDRLVKGEYGYTPVRITFPEGYTSYAMAKAIQVKFPHITPEDFMNEVEGKEGKLFPDTYFFYPYVTAAEIEKALDQNFNRRIAKLKNQFESNQGQASTTNSEIISGYTFDEILIMASIVEKEVRTAEDKALVADLFWRRIKNGMPLQADSTLTYVTGKGSDTLTLAELKDKENPYNSYVFKGLPPTPISNPGLVSIQAALNPKANPYVFFLSDKEGNTHFSETYKEHLRLKEKYLR